MERGQTGSEPQLPADSAVTSQLTLSSFSSSLAERPGGEEKEEQKVVASVLLSADVEELPLWLSLWCSFQQMWRSSLCGSRSSALSSSVSTCLPLSAFSLSPAFVIGLE